MQHRSVYLWQSAIALAMVFAPWFHAGMALAAQTIPADPVALAAAMRDRRVVLLGETHDNGPQHALRSKALRLIVAAGARPAIAFEQFDRERQADIDRARRERPRDADYLIAQAQGGPGWDWSFYRPFVELALEYDLPIVAANLARAGAMRVAREGYAALFDPALQRELALDALPADVIAGQEAAIASGHCNLLPASQLPAMMRAQIARDIVMAQAITPFAPRGVVLLAGNGHVRADVGVPLWLGADQRKAAISIGMVEDAAETAGFDVVVVTAAVPRDDPCKGLAVRLPAMPAATKP